MKAFRIYHEWADMIQKLSDEPFNENHISAIKESNFEMTPLLADKFLKQYSVMLNTLFAHGAEAFHGEYGKTNGREEAILMALMTQKKRMKTLAELCALSFFEEELQENLKQIITQAANQMQSSLEDSAKTDRSGRLTYLVKNNAVNRLADVKEESPSFQPIKIGRRQILT